MITVKDLLDRNEVFCCQSWLVESLFNHAIFDCDNIDNLYVDSEEEEDEEEIQEVYEWWLITSWLEERLEAVKAPILRSPISEDVWYGRTETGQSLEFDYYLNQVVKQLNKE